jgi:hypothetical protein
MAPGSARGAAWLGSRRKMLAELFNDRVQLTRMVLTFIVVFAAFINDSSYVIRGIGRAGPQAEG